MDVMNVILPKVTCLEELPNELFLLIFSYLKSDMVIQTFLDLNQRFQSLILQYSRHLVLSADIDPNWIKKRMLSIENNIQTITLNIKLIRSVFSGKYSYPNLHSITLYSSIDWQVELDTENESPAVRIVSALNVLEKCSFEGIEQNFLNLLESDHRNPTIDSTQTIENLDKDNILPCSAIRRVWMLECNEKSLWKLCNLAPGLTYLKIWLRHSSRFNNYPIATLVRSTQPTQLIELYIKVTGSQSFTDISLLINHFQGSLKRITLDLEQNLLTDGRTLETLLAPCTFLEDVSFISEFSKKQINISNLVRSFQSQWWLDAQRPPVLLHETDFDRILAMSIPCSFSNTLKNVQFSSDLNSWHLNRGTFESLINGSIKTKMIYLSGKQPITLDFLRFVGRIFHSRKLKLACRRWGLMFEQEFFKQFTNRSIMETVLPNITRFNISHTNGLDSLTLAVWLLLAPNVHMLEIEYLTFGEIMEWITELNDEFMMGDPRLKMIFQQIHKITISTLCYKSDERSKLEIVTILTKIFSAATIY